MESATSVPDMAGLPALAGLFRTAEQVGARLRERGETVAVAESSAGGLISAALLAVAGASAYFQGGAVVYTRAAKASLLGLGETELAEPRPATEGHALILARAVRTAVPATWGIGETGATGPTGNRYGDPAGHAWVAATDGRQRERASIVRTDGADRRPNMIAFAEAALGTLLSVLEEDRDTS